MLLRISMSLLKVPGFESWLHLLSHLLAKVPRVRHHLMVEVSGSLVSTSKTWVQYSFPDLA